MRTDCLLEFWTFYAHAFAQIASFFFFFLHILVAKFHT